MFMSAADLVPARTAPRALMHLASVVCLVPSVVLAVFPGWVMTQL
jgi:hypothetical protein